MELYPRFIFLSCNSCAAVIEGMHGAGSAEFGKGGGVVRMCVCVCVCPMEEGGGGGGMGGELFCFSGSNKGICNRSNNILLTCRWMGVGTKIQPRLGVYVEGMDSSRLVLTPTFPKVEIITGAGAA